MARTLLVAIRDPASAAPAVARALQLASPGDRVVLAHARRRRLLEILGAGALRATAPELSPEVLAGDAWLDALRDGTRAPPGVGLEVALIDGEAAHALAALARQVSASVVIAAPARRGPMRELVVGSTLLSLLRQARLPVVIANTEGAVGWRSAAAAVTADPSGLRVVAATRSLAPDTKLSLMHAWRVPDEGRLRLQGVDAVRIEAVRDWARRSAEAALGDVRRAAPHASFVLREGHAASAILEWALDARPDVLFVAGHRGPPAEERLLGSVTQFLIYHWPNDLVMVP